MKKFLDDPTNFVNDMLDGIRGDQVAVLKLDAELKELLARPALTPFFEQCQNPCGTAKHQL